MSRRDLPAAARARLARLPLRARLVAGFVVAITVVLAAAGSFVYWRVSYALDVRLDADLRDAAGVLSPLVSPDGSLARDPSLARTPLGRQYQVLDVAGRVLAAGPQLGARPLLDATQAQTALRTPVRRDLGELLPVSARPLRVLAVPLAPGRRPRVLVVAVRRDQRDEALRELLVQLLTAGLGCLVVSAVVGERLARAALRPVERYRTQAASIAAGASGVRLDVPADRHDEVTRLGATLNEMLQSLEHAFERERRFTQDASHELRTPLTLLSTRVQLALRRPRSGPEYEQVLRELEADLAALTRLARQLLEVGTADSRPAGQPGSDLVAVARAVLTGHGDTAGLREQAAHLPVAMSPAEAGQVLSNLLANAASHGRPPVEVTVRGCGRAAVLTVQDAGDGPPQDFVPTATERFSRAPAARERPGAGLGLSLVQALVDRYDGELRLCSGGRHHRYSERLDAACDHPPDGTSVTVLLPLRP